MRLVTHRSTVEFIDEGSGVPILWSHGIFGGHENVRELVDRWIGVGFRAIGPSRLGYLGSTMPADATPARQPTRSSHFSTMSA